MKASARAASLLSLLLATTACTVDSEAGDRFTYIVRYSVAGTITAAMDVTYVDETGAPVTVNAVTAPWSIDLPAMAYDYDNLFEASLRVFNTTLGVGEELTPAISWLDYKVDFDERVLSSRPTVNGGAAPAAQDMTLYSPPLPD
jgi:hypothetical protein